MPTLPALQHTITVIPTCRVSIYSKDVPIQSTTLQPGPLSAESNPTASANSAHYREQC